MSQPLLEKKGASREIFMLSYDPGHDSLSCTLPSAGTCRSPFCYIDCAHAGANAVA